MNLKTPQQIEDMREGGKMLGEMLRTLAKTVEPGITTKDLEKIALELILEADVKPSFKGEGGGFPSIICTSINEEAVHAVPSNRVLKEGDLLKLDFGIVHKGLHSDSAITILVGDSITKKLNKDFQAKKKLINVTREALYAGISEARVGNTLGDIGAAIQKEVEKNNFRILKELGGHGIGENLHEDPFVSNYGERNEGEPLKTGMVIAIEPITAIGTWKIKDGDDGFAYLTEDASLSAHFEHTVAITQKGPWVLTE